MVPKREGGRERERERQRERERERGREGERERERERERETKGENRERERERVSFLCHFLRRIPFCWVLPPSSISDLAYGFVLQDQAVSDSISLEHPWCPKG